MPAGVGGVGAPLLLLLAARGPPLLVRGRGRVPPPQRHGAAAERGHAGGGQVHPEQHPRQVLSIVSSTRPD